MSARSSRLHRLGLFALLFALVVAAAACSSDDGGGGEDAGATTVVTVDPGPAWVEHEAPAECECAHGDPFSYWSRTADPDKVVLFFQGGGACFSADGCAEGSDQYSQTASGDQVTGTDDEDPSGIFDFTNPDNPFGDYSFVYVPYCTGDLHLGDAEHEYSDDVTISHKGYVNANAAYEHLLAEFGDASAVFVTGSSAGGVPSPMFAGLLADDLPEAEVAVLSDASGAYPSDPVINEAIGSLWGAFENVPDWPENEGLTAADWGVPDLMVQAGLHDPDLRMARYDTAYDEVQADFSELAGFGGDDLKVVITDNEAYIEDGGVPVASYLAPGELHTILGRADLYDLEVDGVSFLDWLTDYANGGDVPDVACTGDCDRPPPADADADADEATTTTAG